VTRLSGVSPALARLGAWLRAWICRRERPAFAAVLAETMERPGVTLSARALEQALLLERRAAKDGVNDHPNEPARAGSHR